MVSKNKFGLSSTISASHNTNPDDVKLLKKLLSENGHYQVPIHGISPYPDTPMINGIKSFQSENNLTVDGIVKPDGPTIGALMARSPRLKCPCGAFHGGSSGTIYCPDCYKKLLS
ncbi:peptidoglycan-binding domain-containing protein [Terasakiella sp. A23]|uniref:peptidoglycan-binding domain-containing protein n=1 Tax=Terasakiella sp. FCG-A23 TaxID=3080561 RepID=UPI002954B601|nr:peptidoglycan-binding domain-containing protein [Terasakiella sp. A23]MDV7339458.1 peptidoglycan-binding domain-containing protein [Terasakiella sp. A23]